MRKSVRGKKNKVPTITIIGAASQVFGFNMCTDICQMPALKGTEVRLVDTDAERLARIGKLFELVSGITSMELQVSVFTDRLKAISGSDYVIISVAHERIDRWEKDLLISRRNGIVETQGECGGPGGLSLTLRNIPLILDIALDIQRLAPAAAILNFSNPMLRVCMALNHYTKLRVVGLCHGLVEVQAVLARITGRRIKVRGCGINHFNWIFSAKWEDSGKDAWQTVVDTFKKNNIPGLKYTRALFKVFGGLVTPDDGHIADFLHHWRGKQNGLNPAYDLHPKEMGTYRESSKLWEKRISGYLNGDKNPMADVTGLSGEGAIPIISAMAGLIPAYNEIAANIPNRGYITNLPEGAVVEVPARVSPGDIHGEKMGALPSGVRSLIARQLDIAELAVEAAVEGNYNKALQSLAIDPIVTDLQSAGSYLDGVLKAHGDILRRFK